MIEKTLQKRLEYNMSGFTCGTWNIEFIEFNDPQNSSHYIYSDKAKLPWIAEVLHWPETMTVNETKANGRLVIAAPEMYKLLGDLHSKAKLSDSMNDRISSLLKKIDGE